MSVFSHVLPKMGVKFLYFVLKKTLQFLWFLAHLLYLQVTKTCIKSRTSSNFGQIGPLTMELVALEA